MVRRRCHGAHPIVSSRETTGDSSGEETGTVSGVVDTLEECKLGSIESGFRVERGSHVLDSYMSMTGNLATHKCLRGRKIGSVGIRKIPSYQVRHLNRDIESSVGFNSSTSGERESNDARNHGRLGRNISHS